MLWRTAQEKVSKALAETSDVPNVLLRVSIPSYLITGENQADVVRSVMIAVRVP